MTSSYRKKDLNDLFDPAILFCIFMPFFGIGLLPSDTQPFAVLLISISAFMNQYIFPRYMLLFFIILNIYFFTIATVSFFDFSIDFIGIIRYLVGFYTPFLVFLFVHNRKPEPELIKKVLDIVLITILIGFLFNFLGLSFINQIFVNRGIFDIESSARSLTSFFPEQSRISTHVSIIFLCYLFINKLNIIRLLLLLVFFVLGLSGESFIVIAVLGTIFAFLGFAYINLRYLILISLGFFFIFQFDTFSSLLEFNFATRGIAAAASIYENGLSYFASDFGLLYKTSGITYGIAPFFNYETLFNIGLYSTQDPNFIYENPHIEMIYSYYFNSSFTPIPRVPYSIFGVLMTDHGIIGLIIFSFIIGFVIKNFAKTSLTGKAILLFLVFLIIVRSVLAYPTIWFILFFIANYKLSVEKESLRNKDLL